MIHTYGITQQGAYHVEKDLPCQDAHYIHVLSDHYAIIAVADGLGSEKFSDIASKIAVKTSVLFCADHITEASSEPEIIDIIKRSFSRAKIDIDAQAEADSNDVCEYDTTLALAVYRNGTVLFGNAGDSGIVVLNQDGLYESITTQQRDENGYVFPLCFEDHWSFGSKNNVSSVLLATDGMLETLFPYLLRNEKTTIYVALARFFMDEQSLHFNELGDSQVQKNIDDFISSITPSQVNDDKTVAVMLDTDFPSTLQPNDYYVTPDWKSLKEKHDEIFQRTAYPQRYISNTEE